MDGRWQGRLSVARSGMVGPRRDGDSGRGLGGGTIINDAVGDGGEGACSSKWQSFRLCDEGDSAGRHLFTEALQRVLK